MPSVHDAPRLREVALLRDRVAEPGEYPFTVPTIAGLDRLTFDRRLTIFVGENGSGKSTLLEAIAVAAGFGAEGGTRGFTPTGSTASTDAIRPLAGALRLSWTRKLTDGFFLRAESFFNVATRMDEVDATARHGGRSLHHRSHGEAFLEIVQGRFAGGGLYLLDEPESALSPQRQLTLLLHLHMLMTEDAGAQVILATHSPILAGYPDAAIWSFDGGEIAPITWDEVPAVDVTRGFVTQRDRWVRRLFDPS